MYYFTRLQCFIFSIRKFTWTVCWQVVQRVKVRVETNEDVWALKIINFIQGANQLLFDGLTRELPL